MQIDIIDNFETFKKIRENWDSVYNVQNILETDTRMSLFLRHFSGEKFEFSQNRIQNQGEDTDHYIAPYVSLTDDWEQYLQNYIGSKTRQKIRRFLRKVESSDEFSIRLQTGG